MTRPSRSSTTTRTATARASSPATAAPRARAGGPGAGPGTHAPFPPLQPEQPRRCGGEHLDPALPGDAAADHPAVVHEVDPVLDAREPVGDLSEVTLPEPRL